MCFMAIKEDNDEDSGELGLMEDEGISKVRLPMCPKCNELQEFIDIALVDIKKVLHDLQNIQREKKDRELNLEVCEIERDMLLVKVHELQLNGLQKSTSHNFIKSNQSTSRKNSTRTRNYSACIHCGKDGHKSNHCRFRNGREKDSESFTDPSCFYCGKPGIYLTIADLRIIEDGFGDPRPQIRLTIKILTIQDPRSLGYLKISNCFCKNTRKNNRKGKWYLESACSRHMTSDKQLFKTVTKLDGGLATFGDKSKGNVIGVGKVPINSSCDVDEVHLADELGYNLLSISQLCDNDYEVRIKNHSWFIKDESCRIIISRNKDRNVYTLSNIDSLENRIFLPSMIDDPCVWHRKLGHASMHTIQKLSKRDLIIGLPKLDFSKDQICDACQLGKQTWSSFKVKNITSTTKPLQLLHMDLFCRGRVI
ncbi:uncharacterized protein [Nicotiana tomentosiformis]|uniref:uncharacterized protein n=1 Tax=Nicotiana tomentosiformis TaxID=4098 RepID=UPI00388C53FC